MLDVGGVNGAPLVRAATRCRAIVGFDYDLAQLAIGARTIREQALGTAHVFAWDITGAFPFPDRCFSAALFLDVIEHLHPRVAALREARVPRDDGRLLVSGPNRATRWRRTREPAGLFCSSDRDHKVEYTREELLAELAAGGFEAAREVEPMVLDTPWTGAIDAVDGRSLGLYERLSRWKRDAALRRPQDSTGFRVVARKRP